MSEFNWIVGNPVHFWRCGDQVDVRGKKIHIFGVRSVVVSKKWFLEHTYLCLKNQEVYQWDQSLRINSFVPTEKGWGLESHGEPLGACHIRKRVSWINIGLCAMETHLRETGKESEYQAGTCAWWISNAMQECRSANRGMTWGLRFGKLTMWKNWWETT